jgi:hypothetical protein
MRRSTGANSAPGKRLYRWGVILVDRAIWAAHGTEFAHLVSDESLAELHAFATAIDGLPRPLKFHRDHYDVPAQFWDQVVARGATVVSTRELVRRLRAAGLRATRVPRPS